MATSPQILGWSLQLQAPALNRTGHVQRTDIMTRYTHEMDTVLGREQMLGQMAFPRIPGLEGVPLPTCVPFLQAEGFKCRSQVEPVVY